MWLLFLIFLGIHGAPIDIVKFAEINARLNLSMTQLQECVNSTLEYKNNSTFRPLTVDEAKEARDEIYSCLLKGEKVMKEKDDFIRALGANPKTKPQRFSVTKLLVAMLNGDMTSLAGLMNFAMDAMKVPFAIMKSDVKQLEKYISSGDPKILEEEPDRTEVEKLTEMLKKESEDILPDPKEAETPAVLLVIPKPGTIKEKPGISVVNLTELGKKSLQRKEGKTNDEEDDEEEEEE